MSAHTPTPWKAVSNVNWDNGLTYTSIQPVTADPDTMNALAMMSGEYHVSRMTHTAARHKIDVHVANAEFIVRAVNAYGDLMAEVEKLRAALKPFAEAEQNLEGQSDGSAIWETSAAMAIDAGHLRAAKAALE